MKVIVTGASGQLGKCLVERLSNSSGVEVIALGKSALDIAKFEEVLTTINKIEPDVIINAAAYTAVDLAESNVNLCYEVNCDGSKNLAIASEQVGALLLHVSTDYVFDGNKFEPYFEEDDTNPQGVYGKSKLEGEQMIQEHCSRYVIIRTSWVFSEYGGNFVKTMLRLGAEKSELKIVDDQMGAPTYAGDLADALLTIMNKLVLDDRGLSAIYHYSGFPYVTWYEFADEIFNIVRRQSPSISTPNLTRIETKQLSLPAPRPENSRLNCNKIKTVFGVEPSIWKMKLSKIVECRNEGNRNRST